MRYPKKYPNTTCKYPNCFASTAPGTDIKVTPDKEAPIIPKATKYHGADLLALKNASLESSLPVK